MREHGTKIRNNNIFYLTCNEMYRGLSELTYFACGVQVSEQFFFDKKKLNLAPKWENIGPSLLQINTEAPQQFKKIPTVILFRRPW